MSLFVKNSFPIKYSEILILSGLSHTGDRFVGLLQLKNLTHNDLGRIQCYGYLGHLILDFQLHKIK